MGTPTSSPAVFVWTRYSATRCISREQVPRDVLRARVRRAEHILLDAERLVELGRDAVDAADLDLVQPLRAEAVDPRALRAGQQREPGLALEIGQVVEPEADVGRAHRLFLNTDDEARPVVLLDHPVVDAFVVAGAVQPLEPAVDGGDVERLVDVDVELVLDHRRVRVLRAFDSDEVDLRRRRLGDAGMLALVQRVGGR